MDTEQASKFTGSIPHHYDEGLGPHIFIDYALDMAKRAAHLPNTHTLELAAGTGIVSRALRNALPASSQLTVTDLNPPMLDIAEAKFQPGEKIKFQQADAMALPFDESSFDLIACQFGVMFFPDKVEAFKQARRVLKPGGNFLFNVWSDMEANPFSQIAQRVTQDVFPDDPPSFYKVPFGYHDEGQILADLEAAGFDQHSHQTIRLDKSVDDWALFARGLVFGNPMIEEIKTRGGTSPEAVVDKFISAFRDRFGHEPASMPLEAKVFSASKVD